MENLMNNGKFIDQTNLGWTFSFEANGKYPMIANRIFETLAEAEHYITTATAIPGLILRVIGDETKGNNGAYLVERDGDGLWLNPLMTGDINIELSVVWARKNAEDKWEECDETDPGAERCLKLKHDEQVTYIPLTHILILDEYAKIVNVNASLAERDASIDANKQVITDLSIYIDEFEEKTHIEIDEINSSMIAAFVHLSDIDSSIDNINSSIDNINSSMLNAYDRLDVIDNSISIINSSISLNTQTINDLSVYVDDFVEETHENISNINASINEVNTHLDNVDSSMLTAFRQLEDHEKEIFRHAEDIRNLKDDVNSLDNRVDTLGATVARHTDWLENASHRLNIAEQKIASIESSLGEHTVTSITTETESMFVTVSPLEQTTGDVTIGIDISVCDHYNEDNAEGLVSANYIEERFQWIEN